MTRPGLSEPDKGSERDQANRLRALGRLGQSVWLDFIDRRLLETGGLRRLIVDDGVSGVTSNPSIFERAIGHTADYDDQLRQTLSVKGIDSRTAYDDLTIADVTSAADELLPTFRASDGRDGFVSLEVAPELALDAILTIDEARRLWSRVGRPNLMIKVPGTEEGVPAFRQLIEDGINVNVTLLFAIKNYASVLEAYVSALEARVKAGQNPGTVAAVASFFVSRIDTAADARVDDLVAAGHPEKLALGALKGTLAVANAKLAYQHFLKVMASDRWQKLAKAGARPQRLLWASTGTKNPAYSDVLYVENLAGPNTVNTMPVQTMNAFRDHGRARPALVENVGEAYECVAIAANLGIDMDAITAELLVDGLRQFAQAAKASLDAVERKRPAAAAD